MLFCSVFPNALFGKHMGIKLESNTIKTAAEVENSSILQRLSEIIKSLLLDIMQESIFGNWRSFKVIDVIFRGIPGLENDMQIRIHTFIFCQLISQLKLYISTSLNVQNITNLVKFATLLSDQLFQGQLSLNMIEITEFILFITDTYSAIESLPVTALGILHKQCARSVLYCFAILNESSINISEIQILLSRCIHYQSILFSPKNSDIDLLKCICHHLWKLIMSNDHDVSISAHNLWKLIVLQKPTFLSKIFRNIKGVENSVLINGFLSIVELV
jgi:hypothetical protein